MGRGEGQSPKPLLHGNCAWALFQHEDVLARHILCPCETYFSRRKGERFCRAEEASWEGTAPILEKGNEQAGKGQTEDMLMGAEQEA